MVTSEGGGIVNKVKIRWHCSTL